MLCHVADIEAWSKQEVVTERSVQLMNVEKIGRCRWQCCGSLRQFGLKQKTELSAHCGDLKSRMALWAPTKVLSHVVLWAAARPASSLLHTRAPYECNPRPGGAGSTFG